MTVLINSQKLNNSTLKRLMKYFFYQKIYFKTDKNVLTSAVKQVLL